MSKANNLLEGKEAEEKYKELVNKNLIIFEAIVGSQAYGTSLPTSDEDKKFIYIAPFEDLLKGSVNEQINVNKDYVGYELGRYLELASTANPNILELLFQDESTILKSTPIYEKLRSYREHFLTKQTRFSFGEYANSQISKARGLNKKISNPMEGPRKSILEFCWVPEKQGSISVLEWLKKKGLKQEYCGLVKIDHMRDTYHLFYDQVAHVKTLSIKNEDELWNIIEACGYDLDDMMGLKYYFNKISKEVSPDFPGIIKKENANDVCLASVPKNYTPLTIMQFNKDGYSKYCADYTSYQKWVKERNEERYNQNQENGADYDSKNMAHCHRLLDMAIEILRDKKLIVKRPNREQLLEIRFGKYSYEDLIKDAYEKIEIIEELYKTSTLPEKVEKEFIQNLLLTIRKEFYAI